MKARKEQQRGGKQNKHLWKQEIKKAFKTDNDKMGSDIKKESQKERFMGKMTESKSRENSWEDLKNTLEHWTIMILCFVAEQSYFNEKDKSYW